MLRLSASSLSDSPERRSQSRKPRSREAGGSIDMRIIDRIERDGAFLFRWRSYGPLVLIPVLIVALLEAADIEAAVGEAWHDYWGVFCYGIALLGLAIRCAVVAQSAPGTSGRNVAEQRADALNVTGLYSVVRHPLYLGNFLLYDDRHHST